jgi:hypothetical protein
MNKLPQAREHMLLPLQARNGSNPLIAPPLVRDNNSGLPMARENDPGPPTVRNDPVPPMVRNV